MFNKLLLLREVERARTTNGYKKRLLLFRHSSRSLERSSSVKNLFRPGGNGGRETVEATFFSTHSYSFTATLSACVRMTKYFTTVAGALSFRASLPLMTLSRVMSPSTLCPNRSRQ